MTRLEDCCARCDTQGCRTTVCIDQDPAALRPCGHVACDACGFCDECPPPYEEGAA